MFDNIKWSFYKVREELADHSIGDFLHSQVFINRIATPVEMDLTLFAPEAHTKQDNDYEFIELKLSELSGGRWHYSISSRRYKAFQFLKKGWRCFAVIKGSIVLGDVWCAPFNQGKSQQVHRDLGMLGICCKEDEAYAFDMFINRSYRGKNLAVPLHRYLHSSLKKEGYRKVYGYYWNDNLPALWMHRMIKFHELPKRLVSRFFFFIHAKFLDQTRSSPLSSKNDS